MQAPTSEVSPELGPKQPGARSGGGDGGRRSRGTVAQGPLRGRVKGKGFWAPSPALVQYQALCFAVVAAVDMETPQLSARGVPGGGGLVPLRGGGEAGAGGWEHKSGAVVSCRHGRSRGQGRQDRQFPVPWTRTTSQANGARAGDSGAGNPAGTQHPAPLYRSRAATCVPPCATLLSGKTESCWETMGVLVGALMLLTPTRAGVSRSHPECSHCGLPQLAQHGGQRRRPRPRSPGGRGTGGLLLARPRRR